jgi:hypothetical protein
MIVCAPSAGDIGDVDGSIGDHRCRSVPDADDDGCGGSSNDGCASLSASRSRSKSDGNCSAMSKRPRSPAPMIACMAL